MNALWQRADKERCITNKYKVLHRELDDMAKTKTGELAKFGELSDNPEKLLQYQKDSGLTRSVCERILSEVNGDLNVCRQLEDEERDAIDGEKSLKTIYRRESGVRVVWSGQSGQKPVDLIVVRSMNDGCILGDCKFGLKSEDAWLLRDRSQFAKEFHEKINAVGSVIATNDGVQASSEMLLIVTSSLVELLKNRIEDYKLDSRCAKIPYEHIHICSVLNIASVCQTLLSGNGCSVDNAIVCGQPAKEMKR